jgi:LPS sulfotransferase NodH
VNHVEPMTDSAGSSEVRHDLTRFVLLSTQRSGSTWVIDMLDAHRAIAAYSEMFLADARGRPSWGGRKDLEFFESFREQQGAAHGAQQAAVVDRYLDRLYAVRPGLAAVGFKLMYGQAGDHPRILDYLAEHRGLVVHLRRRNLLDVVISRELAAARDLYHARQSDAVPPARLRLEPLALLQELDDLEREGVGVTRRCRHLGLDTLEVAYEELRADTRRFADLLEFLGVDTDTTGLRSTLKRLNTRSHHEAVENYRQVKQVLAGTRFAAYLEPIGP